VFNLATPFSYFRPMNENHNPWQIIKEKKIYDNPWIDVIEYDVINPGGGAGIYGKVHFKNIAIGILPLDEDLNTYLVGQYRFVLGQYSWEIPEGGGPIGIDPLDSAKRELKEETGLVAKDWSKLVELHNSNSVTDEYAVIYLARNLELHSAAPEETEQLVIKKIQFEEVCKMVDEGIITDAMTVVAALKVKLMLTEQKIYKKFIFE
jgi:8-oxo-dGTP pyrophosphatase MutT (NUDIX family)